MKILNLSTQRFEILVSHLNQQTNALREEIIVEIKIKQFGFFRSTVVFMLSSPSKLFLLIVILFFVFSLSLSYSLNANNHAIIFDPEILTVAVGDNKSTKIQLVSEHEQTVRITFVYGENRSATTDFIQTLDPVEFDPRKGSPSEILLHIVGIRPGYLIVAYQADPALDRTLLFNDFLRVNIVRTYRLDYCIEIFGWIYFLAWSCSFYPQIFLNLKRKSVVGLNFDFLALNLLGFFCYSIFNIGLYSWHDVQNSYRKIHPYGVIPVLLNDVIFSIHGFFATLITIIQCLLFERSNQRLSYPCHVVLFSFVIFLSLSTVLGSMNRIDVLLVIYFYSYVKLIVSLVKYIPQVLMNYRRKSTVGWSIGNIFFDLLGGVFSLFQMIFLAINYDDWTSISGGMTKFALAMISIGFDLIFIIQHYFLYASMKQENANSGYQIIEQNEDNFINHS